LWLSKRRLIEVSLIKALMSGYHLPASVVTSLDFTGL
jgi:hypothetical protein